METTCLNIMNFFCCAFKVYRICDLLIFNNNALKTTSVYSLHLLEINNYLLIMSNGVNKLQLVFLQSSSSSEGTNKSFSSRKLATFLLINEPTAAALAFGMERSDDKMYEQT